MARLALGVALAMGACDATSPTDRGGTGGGPALTGGAGPGSGGASSTGGAPELPRGGRGGDSPTAMGTGGATGGSIATAGNGGAGAGGGTSGRGMAGAGGGTMGGGAGRVGAGGGATGGDKGTAGAGGPIVDRTNPQLHQFSFTANSLDSKASHALGKQFAYLDTRVAPKGKLVIYLHGADDFANCGNGALGTLVASWGFHWFAPCYVATYGVDNCGNDIEGCRLEAFEGTDHHPFVNISRSDSIEERIIQGLKHLQTLNPQGDWAYFLDGNAPRWSDIVISGHSHGASSSGVIGVHRKVFRVVMLAGPYDPGQAWLSLTPMTDRARFFGFSHANDSQHSGHLAAWQSLGLPGTPTRIDGAQPPFGSSHRLYSTASVSDAHQSVTSGNISGFIDAWHYLYGAD